VPGATEYQLTACQLHPATNVVDCQTDPEGGLLEAEYSWYETTETSFDTANVIYPGPEPGPAVEWRVRAYFGEGKGVGQWSNLVPIVYEPGEEVGDPKVNFRLNLDPAFESHYCSTCEKTVAAGVKYVKEHAAVTKAYYPPAGGCPGGGSGCLYKEASASAFCTTKPCVPFLAYMDPVTKSDIPAEAPLTVEKRHEIVQAALKDREAGASGVWLDNVNWHCAKRNSEHEGNRYFDQEGALTQPEIERIKKEPGGSVTSEVSKEKCVENEEAVGKHEAIENRELIKEIKTKWHEAAGVYPKIEINSQWEKDLGKYRADAVAKHLPGVDPILKEGVAAATILTKEFGEFNSMSGAVMPATGPESYEELLEFIKNQHKASKLIDNLSIANTESQVEYNLASYFLFDSGGDFQGADDGYNYKEWPGFEVKLRTPLSGFEPVEKAYRREFKKKTAPEGNIEFALVNPAGSGTAEWHQKWGYFLKSTFYKEKLEVTLKPVPEGAVFHS